jgi:hypothetical protein
MRYIIGRPESIKPCKYKKCIYFRTNDDRNICKVCARAYINQPPSLIDRLNYKISQFSQPKDMFMSFKERDKKKEVRREMIGYSLIGTVVVLVVIVIMFLALAIIYM